ncbi:alpha-L-arabinofuranosidase C-terminal domain-containing protein [Niabella digestorum]|uniref:non-reducing end alpha-L-arabinofuranosidase n=1 Tax=Niabella digestorum TaxID=3117701 RepID=A0ABU7RF78_9BACT
MTLMKKSGVFKLLWFVVMTITCLCGYGQPRNAKKISTDLFGIFFEDINYAADGGLYAELVQNRSFEYSPTERREWHPLSFWEYVNPGYSYGYVYVQTQDPLHSNNPTYVVIDVEHVGKEAGYTGLSGVGLKNQGFAGMVVKAGEQYNFSMFSRLLSKEPITLSITLQNPQGEILAENTLTISTSSWTKLDVPLIAKASHDTASLTVLATTKGKFALDVVSLFPKNTFKNRPNGLRPDLAQVIADLKPRFVRFPGGCLVHGDGLGNMYRWKQTVGPIEQRKEQRNLWGYHQTGGLGYFEYFQFCEDIGAKPVPVVPAAVSCQNSGGTWRIGGTGQKALPLDEMQEYIQEILDLIEWANGPATSKWGAVRAAAGHPEPFNLEYLAIGNEEKITPEFEQRFRMIYEAVKAKHPEITLIGTSGPFHSGEDFDKGWQFANELKVPIVDEHYYTDPKWYLSNHYRYDAYDRSKGKVYLGEYASWGSKLYNAIAEAAYMIGLERNGDVVVMSSYAPLLGKMGFTQWNPDLIYFDNKNIYPTINYYVQQLFSTNAGDYYVPDVVALNRRDSVMVASCVYDSKTGDAIIKLANAGKENKKVKIDLSAFKNIQPVAARTVITGNEDDENKFGLPSKIAPVTDSYKVARKFDYEVPAMSFVLIRIKTKK